MSCDFPSLSVPSIGIAIPGLPTLPSPSLSIDLGAEFDLPGVPSISFSVPALSIAVPGLPTLPTASFSFSLPDIPGLPSLSFSVSPILVAVPGLPTLPTGITLPTPYCPLE